MTSPIAPEAQVTPRRNIGVLRLYPDTHQLLKDIVSGLNTPQVNGRSTAILPVLMAAIVDGPYYPQHVAQDGRVTEKLPYVAFSDRTLLDHVTTTLRACQPARQPQAVEQYLFCHIAAQKVGAWDIVLSPNWATSEQARQHVPLTTNGKLNYAKIKDSMYPLRLYFQQRIASPEFLAFLGQHLTPATPKGEGRNNE